MQKTIFILAILFFFTGLVFAADPFPKTRGARNNDQVHTIDADAVTGRQIVNDILTAKPLSLTLEDAILLAVRDNPNVQSSKLDYVLQKFNLFVQQWQFYPHYAFQASVGFNENKVPGQPIVGSHNYNIQPSVSILLPTGMTASLTASNLISKNYNPGLSLQVAQPLLRGFGRAVVESALNNARDSEVISRLNVEGTLRSTITTVINSYLDVVSAEQTIMIDKKALGRANQSVMQTKLFIKAGRKAGNELITVQANVATAKSQLENDKNSLTQARNALLTAIGIDPNTEVHFANLNLDHLISQYHLPPLNAVKCLVLDNDIQFQTDQITLHGSTKRQLANAYDNTRWQLNFTANVATGSGTGGGRNAGFNSLFNGANQSRGVGLTLQIPIDDQLAKQGLLNAKIALQRAELALVQAKWNKETSAINAWHLVLSAKQALIFAKDAENLQLKTYQVGYQKYLHGLIDSLELQTAQVQLIQVQQSSLRAQISYLKALVTLDSLIGNTLKTWHINARLS